MLYIGIDYGKTKIGVSCSEGTFASALGIISNSPKTRLQQLTELIRKTNNHTQETNITVVLGIPQSDLDIEIYEFAHALQTEFGWQTVFEDETLTTQEALSGMIENNTSLKKRRSDDDAAAVIILQRFLNNLKVKPESLR